MSFNIKNKLVLTDNLQFVSSPLYSFVKKISKDEFKYLKNLIVRYQIQLTRKDFIPMTILVVSTNLKKNCLKKKDFYISLTDTKTGGKELRV